MEHGLKVTQIHQVVIYLPSACFQKFGDNISEALRAGDADPEKKIVAETRKLDGNSSYGKTGTNKERHRRHLLSRASSQSLSRWPFRRCNFRRSFTAISWTCLWIVGTSSIAPRIQIVLIWLCLLPVWKKWSNQICSSVTRWKKKNWFPRTDTPQFAAYDKRTPGLFKTEFTGDGMIALCSKTYFCYCKNP